MSGLGCLVSTIASLGTAAFLQWVAPIPWTASIAWESAKVLSLALVGLCFVLLVESALRKITTRDVSTLFLTEIDTQTLNLQSLRRERELVNAAVQRRAKDDSADTGCQVTTAA